MKRVIAVGKYGNVVEKEDYDDKTHNMLVYEMFKEIIESISKENLKGDIIQYWYNAGLITKEIETMFYLEDIKLDEVINSVVCIIPEFLSESQVNYFEENYLNSPDTFIGVNYNGDEFGLLNEKTVSSTGMYNFLKEKRLKLKNESK